MGIGLTIIEIAARESDGFHGLQSQSHRRVCWEEGWAAVPPELAEAAWESEGYCDIEVEEQSYTLEDGTTGSQMVVTRLTPTEKPPKPEPEPTREEKLQADVDYIAALTGVEL